MLRLSLTTLAVPYARKVSRAYTKAKVIVVVPPAAPATADSVQHPEGTIATVPARSWVALLCTFLSINSVTGTPFSWFGERCGGIAILVAVGGTEIFATLRQTSHFATTRGHSCSRSSSEPALPEVSPNIFL